MADVVLLGERVGQVAEALQLSSATLGKIRQNLAWAFAYNAIALPLAAGALLPSAGLALTPALSGASQHILYEHTQWAWVCDPTITHFF